MKTSKLLTLVTTVSIFLMGIVACADKIYRMDTQINGNGSGERTIYAHGDSAFLLGDTSHNPFLFAYSSDWRFKEIDTVESVFDTSEIYNVNIQKSFRSIAELSDGLVFSEEIRPFLAPKERLEKHFRWFYTCYSFEVAYPHISTPVSIDKYMNKDEQKCWFQGDFSIYRGMSGFECKDDLDNLEAKFGIWYAHNTYEVSFNTVRYFTEQAAGNPYFSGLENVRDTLFTLNLKDLNKNDILKDISPELVCTMLDTCYHTTVFSNLFSANKDAMNRHFDEQMRIIKEIPNKILLEYHLILPGKVSFTNAAWNRSDTLIWKVNGIRLYASEDYRLSAESRETNVWAFVVTFLAGLVLLIFCVRQIMGYRNECRSICEL